MSVFLQGQDGGEGHPVMRVHVALGIGAAGVKPEGHSEAPALTERREGSVFADGTVTYLGDPRDSAMKITQVINFREAAASKMTNTCPK